MPSEPSDHRADWHRYYSRKRVVHQCRQVELLRDLDIQRVLEIGPYLGFVTALLNNAGYAVTTLDRLPQAFAWPRVPHIEAGLTTLAPDRIAGFDAILCCETLEHLWWPEANAALRTFHASGSRYLILSVPFSGVQLAVAAYMNRFAVSTTAAMKLRNRFRRFRPDDDPMGHKWEIGYRGRPLRTWEQAIHDAGWRIARRDFTFLTRSVFHVCERA